MAAPTYTQNAAGNVITSQSLALSASVTGEIDIRTKVEGILQVKDTGGGTVQAGANLRIQLWRKVGTGPAVDTEPFAEAYIASAVSTTKYRSFRLPPGLYRVNLTNQDSANAIVVEATLDTVDTIA